MKLFNAISYLTLLVSTGTDAALAKFRSVERRDTKAVADRKLQLQDPVAYMATYTMDTALFINSGADTTSSPSPSPSTAKGSKGNKGTSNDKVGAAACAAPKQPKKSASTKGCSSTCYTDIISLRDDIGVALSGANPTFIATICPGTYYWPVDEAGLDVERSDDLKMKLDLSCCGTGCVIDGGGSAPTNNERDSSLFYFKSPVDLTFHGITFQNIRCNRNGALVYTDDTAIVTLDNIEVNAAISVSGSHFVWIIL